MSHHVFHETMLRRYNRFFERARANDPNAAAEEFAKMCHLLRRSDLKISERVLASFSEGWIDLFWQTRNHEQMLQTARDAQQLFGNDPEWRFAEGEALFNLGRFEEAQAALAPLTAEEFEEPMLFYLLACLAERRGEDEAAMRLFKTANRLDEAGFRVPVPIGEKLAVEHYQHSLSDLPEKIQWHLREVPVYVDDLPSDDLIHSLEPPLDPLVMGLFMGQPMGSEASSWASDQPRILLFHKNIAKIAGDFETLDDELRKTLFHEVGHFLGFDEDQLDEMGLA